MRERPRACRPRLLSRPIGRPTALAILGLWLAGVGVAAASPRAGAPDRALPPRPSLRDSPGWVPLVDPESTSVLLGRRPNAPRVQTPFRGGARSLDELGRAVCRQLHRRAADSLLALCVSQEEFRDILWLEFPQSRPATGLTWEDGWRALGNRLLAGTHDATGTHGGRHYEFLRFERADTTARYKNFRLHHGLILVARNDEGQIEKMRWIRSIAERNGRFKIYSTTD